MIINYYAIYDKKAVGYGQVFPSQTPGTAERAFRESINNKDSQHFKYPDDFALYVVFEFDDELGTITKTFEPPQLIVEGSALVSV